MGQECPLLISTRMLLLQVTKLGKLVTAQTKAVIVNFPHNPTGALLSHKDWQQIVQQCKDHNAYLFSDEMYR